MQYAISNPEANPLAKRFFDMIAKFRPTDVALAEARIILMMYNGYLLAFTKGLANELSSRYARPTPGVQEIKESGSRLRNEVTATFIRLYLAYCRRDRVEREIYVMASTIFSINEVFFLT